MSSITTGDIPFKHHMEMLSQQIVLYLTTVKPFLERYNTPNVPNISY